jgi:hypothetical protein
MTDETREKLIVLREALLEAPAEMTPAMVVGFINNMLADSDTECVVPYNGCPNPDDEGGG